MSTYQPIPTNISPPSRSRATATAARAVCVVAVVGLLGTAVFEGRRSTLEEPQAEPDNTNEWFASLSEWGAIDPRSASARSRPITCAKLLRNDLPPLQRFGFVLESLPRVLEQERDNECLGGHLFVLDRIVVSDMARELVRVVEAAGYNTAESMVRREADDGLMNWASFDPVKYFTDFNGARMLAWEVGMRRGAHWVSISDGDFAVTPTVWADIDARTTNSSLDIMLGWAAARLAGPYSQPKLLRLRESVVVIRCDPTQRRVTFPTYNPRSVRGATCVALEHLGVIASRHQCAESRWPVALPFGAVTRQFADDPTPLERQLAVHVGSALLRAHQASLAHPGVFATVDKPRLEVFAELRDARALLNVTVVELAVRIGLELPSLFRAQRPPAKILCARILGNDLPPLQRFGQTYTSLKHVLEHQSTREGQCERAFLVNRIVDDSMRVRLLGLLATNGVHPSSIFAREVDWTLPVSSLGVSYWGDINGARNILLDEGIRRGMDWVDLNDANVFVPDATWQSLVELANSPLRYSLIAKPMRRLQERQHASWLNAASTFESVKSRQLDPEEQEPQLMVSLESGIRFDENLRYARRNKLRLLMDKCGLGYFSKNVELDDRSGCVVARDVVFRLFSFPAAVLYPQSFTENRARLRKRGIELMTSLVASLHAERRGKPTRKFRKDLQELKGYAGNFTLSEGLL